MDQIGNIHLHLDLIAGLPLGRFCFFCRSFDQVFAIRPRQLQLGFLKVLKGSAIHRQAAQWEITASSRAPYEVLSTRWLSFRDLLSLKEVEEMVEIFLQQRPFFQFLEAILPAMNLRSPYSPSWALIIPNKVTIWSATLRSSIMKSSEIFAWKAGAGVSADGSSWHCWIFASTKNPRSFRNFCPWSNFLLIKIGIATFMKIQKISRPICRIIWGEHPRRLAKITHLQWFPFALVPSGSNGRTYSAQPGETAVLFDYGTNLRNLTGRAYMQILFTVTGKESTSC